MEENPEESLARVAELGYKEVESATYTGTGKFYGMTGSEFDQVLKNNGLSIPSGHYLLGAEEIKGTILSDWEKAVEDAEKTKEDMYCGMSRTWRSEEHTSELQSR